VKISGFTLANDKVANLYYPYLESIQSILPLVDEMIVALDDKVGEVRSQILSLQSPKIKIIDTTWDTEAYPDGTILAQQTDIAKQHCTGDWLFYIQSDEVFHEQYLQIVKASCEKYLHDKEVEGLLFDYRHFYGDYEHYLHSHGIYPKEIRVIRNLPDIHSWGDAQSFRKIPHFDYKNYRQKEGTFKLKVVKIAAYMFHYGWTRPPHFMQNKRKNLHTVFKGKEKVAQMFEKAPDDFDYGPLGRLSIYKGTHPQVMQERLKDFHWGDKLHYGTEIALDRPLHKHEKFKNRLLTQIERLFFKGEQIFGYSNWVSLRR
jgi:hypothetical protein